MRSSELARNTRCCTAPTRSPPAPMREPAVSGSSSLQVPPQRVSHHVPPAVGKSRHRTSPSPRDDVQHSGVSQCTNLDAPRQLNNERQIPPARRPTHGRRVPVLTRPCACHEDARFSASTPRRQRLLSSSKSSAGARAFRDDDEIRTAYNTARQPLTSRTHSALLAHRPAPGRSQAPTQLSHHPSSGAPSIASRTCNTPHPSTNQPRLPIFRARTCRHSSSPRTLPGAHMPTHAFRFRRRSPPHCVHIPAHHLRIPPSATPHTAQQLTPRRHANYSQHPSPSMHSLTPHRARDCTHFSDSATPTPQLSSLSLSRPPHSPSTIPRSSLPLPAQYFSPLPHTRQPPAPNPPPNHRLSPHHPKNEANPRGYRIATYSKHAS